jgi:dienelactone hydrolase
MVEPYLEPGVTIANGYSLDTIEYVTHGRTSLATVAIPFPVAPPEGGYGIVAIAHGTVGIDDPCRLSGTLVGSGLAASFGARGAIGIAPDYPGLGTAGVLPYLVSEVEGAAVLDAMRAAAALAHSRGVAISNRYAAAGLSEGGHAVLAAAAMHGRYAHELDVRAFAAAAPATVWLEQWRLGMAHDGPLVPIVAMMSYAWADHYGVAPASIFTAAMLPTIEDAMHASCAFDGFTSAPTIATRLGTSATALFDADFLAAFRAGDFGDRYAAFGRAFTANRIGPYTQTAPLAIWQGDADTIVPRASTDRVVDALRAGGVTVDYRVVPSGEHTTVAFGTVVQSQLRTEESTRWVLDRLAH